MPPGYVPISPRERLAPATREHLWRMHHDIRARESHSASIYSYGIRRPNSLSPAVFPWRLRYGQWPHPFPAFGLHYPQDHHRMIAVRLHDPFDLAFDVRG